MSVITDVNPNQIATKGEEIYQRLKEKFEPEYKGKILAIEVDSGDYFLGNTLIEAGNNARAKHSDKIFYAVKIGYPAVYRHR